MNCSSKKAWLLGLFIGLSLLLFPLVSYSANNKKTTSPPYQGAKIWATPEIITNNIKKYGSTAVDSNNHPAIVYESQAIIAQRDLGFAKWTGTEWELEIAEASILGGFQSASLAIDNNDNPHISYAECLSYDCEPRYTTKTDGSWTYMRFLDGFGALDIGTNDSVHIGYHHETTNNIKHMVMPDDTWELNTVDTDAVSNQHTSLKVDQDGSPRITYYKNDGLYHARTIPPFWFPQLLAYVPASDSLDGQYTSLAIDSNNYSHIAYYDGEYKILKYGYFDETGWHSDLVDVSADVGLYVAMVLDSDDRPHIVYYDVTNTAIKYARQTADGWVATTIDDNVPNGDTIGLAIDDNGRLHLSYHFYEAFMESALKYTWSDLTTFNDDVYLPIIIK